MIKPEDVIDEAKTWLETPFHHEAMIKGVGVDCGHLIMGAFSAVGAFAAFKPDDYPPDWHFHRGEERFLDCLRKVADPVGDPLPARVVMFRFGRCASHGGIVIEWPLIIHAYFGQGVVFSDISENLKLRGRVHSFWQVRGVG